jgi:hypothetical protein
MKITLFSTYVQNFNVLTTYEISGCHKIFHWFFYKIQTSTNWNGLILKGVVISIAFVRTGIILAVVREITPFQKDFAHSQFYSKIRHFYMFFKV